MPGLTPSAIVAAETKIVAQRKSVKQQHRLGPRFEVNLMTRPDVVPRPLPVQTYEICRSYEVGTIITGVAAPATGVISFTLNSMPSSGEFTALFDQYRIVQALISFQPLVTQTNANAQHPGYIHTVLDYDDGTALTAVTQAEQYDTYKKNSLTDKFTRCLEPAPSVPMYTGVTTTGYSVAPSGKKGMWMDQASPGIFYYGVKYVTDGTQVATAAGASSVSVLLWVQFRRPY